MSILYFALAAAAGFGLTAVSLGYYRKQGSITDNQEALILSIGFTITWLAAFFAPFLASKSRGPANSTIIFGIVLSVSTGLMTYLAARLMLWIKRRRK